MSLVSGLQAEEGYKAQEWVKYIPAISCWQLEMDHIIAGATWNRLPHTESGGSQCQPSLYHSVTRDTVLHSPTLPHSLSDHLGEWRFPLRYTWRRGRLSFLIKINDILKSIYHLKLIETNLRKYFSWKLKNNCVGGWRLERSVECWQ